MVPFSHAFPEAEQHLIGIVNTTLAKSSLENKLS